MSFRYLEYKHENIKLTSHNAKFLKRVFLFIKMIVYTYLHETTPSRGLADVYSGVLLFFIYTLYLLFLL